MSKEPIRLTREEALGYSDSASYFNKKGTINAVFDAAEREAEFDPKDVQVGDEIEFRVVGKHGPFKATVLFRTEYTLLIENCDSLGRRVIGTYDVTRIVTRATPRVGDTVECLDHPEWGPGLVNEYLSPSTVSFARGHQLHLHELSSDRLRIVHRPEGS